MSRRFDAGDDLEDVQVGDVVVSMGVPHVITRIAPYDPTPVGYPGEAWKIAYEDRLDRKPWGITVPRRK